MRMLLMVAVLALTLTQAPAGTGSIQGTVEQASTKAGIADVQIAVTMQPPFNPAAPPPSRQDFPAATQTVATFQTDASGHFELKNLAAGTYILQATREGYTAGMNQLSGTVRPLAIEATSVVADQTSKVTFSMTRGSTISGRITDTNRNSLTSATVAAFQREYQDGRVVIRNVLSKQTDDRGEYRLFFLNPGEYYIGITSQGGARLARGAAEVTSVSNPSFYPGVIETKAATRIKLTEGADLTGISFSLKAGPAGVTVSGKVANSLPNVSAGPRGAPPQPSPRQFYLVPLDPNAVMEVNPTAIQNRPGVARGGTSADFQIVGVLPGAYDLIGLVADDQGRPFPGRAQIDVGNQDVTGVVLPVHPGVEVKGHITVRGEGPVTSADLFSFGLRPADGTPSFALSSSLSGSRGSNRGGFPQGTAPPDPSVFSYANVPEGRYAFQVRLLKPSAYVEDIREGTRSIFDSGLTIENGKAPGEIQVVINSNGETFEGSVVDATEKPVEARVVLVPVTSRRQNGNLYKVVMSNAMGKFSIPGVAPGDYTLFAWEDVPYGAWQNAEFMTRYETLGTPVKAAAGIRNDLQLRVIPAGR